MNPPQFDQLFQAEHHQYLPDWNDFQVGSLPVVIRWSVEFRIVPRERWEGGFKAVSNNFALKATTLFQRSAQTSTENITTKSSDSPFAS